MEMGSGAKAPPPKPLGAVPALCGSSPSLSTPFYVPSRSFQISPLPRTSAPLPSCPRASLLPCCLPAPGPLATPLLPLPCAGLTLLFSP